MENTILVTGASSGIGRAIAILCAQKGWHIVLTGRNVLRLEETRSLMEGDEHLIIPADLTDKVQQQALVNEMPILNGVVHCAGVGSRMLGRMLEDDDVRKVMSVNFVAPVLLQAALLREKKLAREATIVFIASTAATMPSVGNSIYSASKAALVAYAKCLSIELAPRRQRVNCISPAMVWTDLALVGADVEQLREAEQAYPLKRYGQPQDIAPMAVYLLSDDASWITGSNFELTGGTQTL